MNIGKDNRHPRYKCDKCGNEIHFIHQKGFVGLNKYYKQRHHDYINKKAFDLCENCEKKLRKWLKEKEIPTPRELLDTFPRWEEVKTNEE